MSMDFDLVKKPRTPRPEYAAAPVSEVALAVHFAPLEKWRSAHAGLYWGASAEVNCQSALVWCLLRLASQAATSSTKVCLSAIRRSRH
jgi:hypothetical protein